MASFKLKIVTPEKEIFDEEVEMVTASTREGEVGILPNHVSLMAQLKPGELRIKQHGKEIIMAVGSGLLQVAGGTVTIATDLAESAENINEKEVEEAHERAKIALEQKLDNEEYVATTAALEKALAQLKVKHRHRAH